MLEETKLNISAVNVSVVFKNPPLKFSLKGYKNFLSNNNKNADIKIEIYSGKLPRFNPDNKKCIFKNRNLWELYKFGKKRIFLLRYPEFLISYLKKANATTSNAPYYKIIIANNNFSKISVYLKDERKFFNKYKKKFEYKDRIIGSIEDILVILIESYISLNKKGLLFHSAGVIDKNRGYLFIGSSGKGKTTISYLFQKENSTILNDDKIIVYPQNGTLWLSGTPWHGRNYNCCSLRAPLRKIFFIDHGRKNEILPSNSRTIIPALLKHSHFPLWDTLATKNAIDFCNKIAQQVPIAELHFLPDRRVIDFIRNKMK